MNFNTDTVIFRCELKDGFIYYPIGLLMCEPKNVFFGFIKQKCIDGIKIYLKITNENKYYFKFINQII